MARVKGGVVSRRRRNKVLKANEGHFGSRHALWKKAHESWLHAGQYAFEHRRKRKRDMRRLWIARINAAARLNGLSYNRLIAGLEKANIGLDRKTLANLAATDAAAFAKVAEVVKAA